MLCIRLRYLMYLRTKALAKTNFEKDSARPSCWVAQLWFILSCRAFFLGKKFMSRLTEYLNHCFSRDSTLRQAFADFMRDGSRWPLGLNSLWIRNHTNSFESSNSKFMKSSWWSWVKNLLFKLVGSSNLKFEQFL